MDRGSNSEPGFYGARPDATRAFRRIAAFGNRVLRVVYYDAGTEYRIITVFFDRQASRRRPIP